MKPHWINVYGLSKSQKFRCSECKNDCFCIDYSKDKNVNHCNYKFCPNCGKEMDLDVDKSQ